jgi:microcystin-dependent protein
MSYIGNAKSPLIIGSNTRDDLVPTFNGQTTFQLSQEVPGGDENSITILKQKYETHSIITNNTDISIEDTDRTVLVDDELIARTEIKITTTNVNVALAISAIKSGDRLTVSVSDSTSSLNDTFQVLDVIYTGDVAHVYIATSVAQRIIAGTEVSLTTGRYNDWTILEPEIDYNLGTTGDTVRTLTLSQGLSVDDKAYVLHRGEATYNLTPSDKSVGPNQLQDNLRNFRCDRYTANGSTSTFILTQTDSPSYDVIDAKSLLVSVDGEILDSDYLDDNGDTVAGAWILDIDRTTEGLQTITFHDVPNNGTAIRILHLGFSTVSRRAAFSPGQGVSVVLPNTIDTDQLKTDSVIDSKIANGAVLTTKIRNNAVTGNKILLNNNDSIRGKTSSGTEQDLLKVASDNSTNITGATEVSVSIAGTKTATISSSSIVPETSDVSLGSSVKKFKDGHFSGDVSVSGNISVDASSTIGGVNITTLNDTVTALKSLINSGSLSPVGSIMIWSSTTVPSNWLRCDGSSVNTYTHRELHLLIGNTYGGTAYQAGVTDIVGATTTFNLPDLITRFPVGANSTTSNIGQNENVAQSSRTISHTHVGAAHTHTFTHTHGVPGHYHSVDTSVGSTIAISLSGDHVTALNHTHLTAYSKSNGLVVADTTGVSASTLIYASGHTGTDAAGGAGISRNLYTNASLFPSQGSAYTQWQDGEHLHKLNTGSMATPHGHRVSVVDHAHNIGFRDGVVRKKSTTDSENSTLNQVASVGAATTAQASGTGGFTASTGSTTSPLTGTAFNTDVVGENSTLHYHEIKIDRSVTTHYTGSTQYLTVTGGHSHFVSIPEHKGNSTSSGQHTHTTSSFSGSIGKVTGGSDGNLNITTNAMPTADATVPVPTSEQLGNTGSATPSHLVVNFIIKVANTQVV